jgi:hypothetical protein
MSPREAEVLQRRILDLIERFGQEIAVPPGKREYHAMFAAYVRPGELRVEEGVEPLTPRPKKRGSRAP